MKKSLFNKEVLQELIDRINRLTPESKALWGKMNAAQMVTHLRLPLEVSLGEKEIKVPVIFKLMRPLFKGIIFGEKQFKKNMQTMKEMAVQDNRDFETEKHKLLNTLERYSKTNGNLPNHPFWGQLSQEENGWGLYKHTSYHLNQFGV